MAAVDASLVTSALLRTDANHLRALSWLNQQIVRRELLIAPAILAAEVTGAVYRITGDVRRAERVLAWLTAGVPIHLVHVSPVLAAEAARLSIKAGLRGCDAIYVALAAQTGEPLITLDREQRIRGATVAMVTEPQ